MAPDREDRDGEAVRSQMLEDVSVFEQAGANFEFFRTHWENLRVTYPDQWVAIRGGKPVANADTVQALQATLRELGIDDSLTLVEFVPDPNTSVFA